MIRAPFLDRLRLPVIIAPMFLVSTAEMVVAAGKAGILGTYLAPNARTLSDLEIALETISSSLAPGSQPWAASLIVHRTYDRFDAEMEMIARFRPPLVITALGNPARIAPTVQAYGGAVFCDVATVDQARRALDSGVDGLILLCTGAGGHTGHLSPFAFIEEVRSFWDGPLTAAGAVGSAAAIRAALELGADYVYMGTRFLPARESMVTEENRQMVLRAGLSDIILSDVPTGLAANWLADSLRAAGIDPRGEKHKAQADFSTLRDEVKAWKHIWSAGQSVGRSRENQSVEQIADELVAEFRELAARSACGGWPRVI